MKAKEFTCSYYFCIWFLLKDESNCLLKTFIFLFTRIAQKTTSDSLSFLSRMSNKNHSPLDLWILPKLSQEKPTITPFFLLTHSLTKYMTVKCTYYTIITTLVLFDSFVLHFSFLSLVFLLFLFLFLLQK